MKLYLAGPMRGYPEFNFPAFDRAAATLRAQGHQVFSPAERDRHIHGDFFEKGVVKGELSEVKGFSLRHALKEDTAWICDHAEGIVLLEGWSNSAGACAERALAKALDLKIFYFQVPLREEGK